MREEVEGIMKDLEITGESPLDTMFSHKDCKTAPKIDPVADSRKHLI
jgi:hypothetical protein